MAVAWGPDGRTAKRAKKKPVKRKPRTPRFTATATVEIGAAAGSGEWSEVLGLCVRALDTGNYADLCRACIKANRLTGDSYREVALFVAEATIAEIDKREGVGRIDGMGEFRW